MGAARQPQQLVCELVVVANSPLGHHALEVLSHRSRRAAAAPLKHFCRTSQFR